MNLNIVDLYPAEIKRDLNGSSQTIRVESPMDYLEKSLELGKNGTSIVDMLDEPVRINPAFKQWKQSMPKIDNLPNIDNYQASFNSQEPESHIIGLDCDFDKIKATLPIGQVLFHGGYWFDEHSNEIISNRYWSTSFSPIYASMASTGKHKNRPLDINQIFIITIMSSDIKFYCYDNEVVDGHYELEVLLDKNIKLKRMNKFFIDNLYMPLEIIEVGAYKL